MDTKQIEQDIRQVVAGAATGKQPLYGHTSEATAYLVDDYPYGRTVRTQIRYWIEHRPRQGWRFLSQTRNPKTESWNKPKASTYADLGGAMYLDDAGHVQFARIGAYSSDRDVLAFLRDFPQADHAISRMSAQQKLAYLRDLISGRAVWTINGVPKPPSPADLDRMHGEVAIWEQIRDLVR